MFEAELANYVKGKCLVRSLLSVFCMVRGNVNSDQYKNCVNVVAYR